MSRALNLLPFIIVVSAFAGLVIWIIANVVSPFFDPYPKTGQVWVKYRGDKADPFKAEFGEKRTVLNVKDGYVLWVDEDGFKSSSDAYYFRYKSDLYYDPTTPQ